MTQDVVTASEAAAPSAIPPGLPDAQSVCERLNEALLYHSFRPTPYSKSTCSILQRAWQVASHKRSRQVTIFHVAYALVFDQPEAGKELTEYLGTDVDAFAIGCILKLMNLGTTAGNAQIVPPAVGTVRWLNHAMSLARTRGRECEVRPDDLVRAVLEDALDLPERDALRRAVNVGNARHDAVLGPRSGRPIETVPPPSRDIIEHLKEVEEDYAPEPEPGGSGANLTEVLTRLEAFEKRHDADVQDRKEAMSRVEVLANRQLELVERHILPTDDAMLNRLRTIDGRVSAIDERVPRPPSAARLAAAIVAVLLLGLAAGLVLTGLRPGTTIAQATAPHQN